MSDILVVGITTLVYLWVQPTCTCKSKAWRTSQFCGAHFTIRETSGSQWLCSLAAREVLSRSWCPNWAWACMMESLHWMTSHFTTAHYRCPWTSVLPPTTSTVGRAERVWTASSSVTLLMTVAMEPMRKTAVRSCFNIARDFNNKKTTTVHCLQYKTKSFVKCVCVSHLSLRFQPLS